MRRRLQLLLAVLLAFAFLAPAPAGAHRRPAAASASGGRILALVNQARARVGAPPLRANGALAAVAAEHARNMARAGRISHAGFPSRIRRAGFTTACENVAMTSAPGDASARIVTMWLRSPGHRRCMLGAQYNQAGAGVARDGRGRVFAALDVGRR